VIGDGRPLAEEARASILLALARERFNSELQDIEIQIIRHSCGFEDPPDWSPNDEPEPKRDSTGRPLKGWEGPQVRPSFLRWLLTDSDATSLLEHRGLRIREAKFCEPLDLRGCRIPVRVEFRYCLFSAKVFMISAEILSVYFMNSTIDSEIEASRLALRGPLFFRDCVITGLIRLDQARIDGEVFLGSCSMTTELMAISMRNAEVADDLRVFPKFKCAGGLQFEGIRVNGNVVMSGAELTSKTEKVIFSMATIKGIVVFKENFQSNMEMRFVGARVGGQISGSSSKLAGYPDSLVVDQAKVGGGVFLDQGFTAAGRISFIDSDIEGEFCCKGATLSDEDVSLILSSSRIRGGVLLRDKFSCGGRILMRLTQIGGWLECNGAHLKCSKDAFLLEGSRITGNVYMADKFVAEGTVTLQAAEVGGVVNCKGGTFNAPETSLSLEGARIKSHVLFSFGFTSKSRVNLLEAEIGGQLSCEWSDIKALMAENTRTVGNLFWRGIQNPDQATLHLVGATFNAIHDDRASWPLAGRLKVNGLVAKEFQLYNSRPEPGPGEIWKSLGVPFNAADRIEWLNLQSLPDLTEPQPWMHLSHLLEQKGHKRGARRVVLELRKHQARANWKSRKMKWIGKPTEYAIAFLEEQPLKILVPILLCVLLGSSVFWRAQNYFSPTSESAVNYLEAKHTLPPGYPKFQPVVYSLENVLPVIKLGQDDHWSPNAIKSPTAVYWLLAATRWCLILAGWAQGLILATAISARFRS
jgi:hypothetical protein